ncbi:MAG: FkbM family methyltransferase [Desulfobacterales bacterium]|nr:FkbM family methyltransferase [Desulfobacterales bacterium]
MVVKFFKSILPRIAIQYLVNFNRQYLDGYAVKSYSQEGEDLILQRVFEKKSTGFYIDIGAHHPKRFSNTYLFYKKGWNGINIDAMPGSMDCFNRSRPNDINLEYGIANFEGVLTYYMFSEPALNTFSRDLALNRMENSQALLRKASIRVFPLETILNKYLSENREIDFMTIDAEGLDFPIITSNDWNRYRPKVILIESLCFDLSQSEDNEIIKYLRDKGYELFAKTFNTLFLKLTKSAIMYSTNVSPF